MKYWKIFTKLIIFLGFLLTLFGGWATERQETLNASLFWESNRLVNGIGVVFLIFAWAFWEMFNGKKIKVKHLYLSISCLIISIIMINGVLGLVGGLIALIFIIIVVYVMNQKESLFKFTGTKEDLPLGNEEQ